MKKTAERSRASRGEVAMRKIWPPRFALASCIAMMALLAPTAANAGHAQSRCANTPGFVVYSDRPVQHCVRAIVEDINLFCFTNTRNQPQCGATARVGAVGSVDRATADAFVIPYLRFRAISSIYKTPPPVGPYSISIPKFQFASMQDTDNYSFASSPYTMVQRYGTAHVNGPAGGCLAVTVGFTVIADTGWGAFGGVAPVVSSYHSHGAKSKTYCAPPSLGER